VIIATANRKAAMSLPEEETTQQSASAEEQSFSSLLRESPVDWEALTHRVNSHPEEVKCERPPLLHKVIPLNPPLEALQKVIDADKEALRISCHCIYGMPSSFTPLGVACKSMAPLEVVQLILRESLGNTESSPGRPQKRQMHGDPPEQAHTDFFVTTDFGLPSMSLDYMRALLEVYPQGLLEQCSTRRNYSYIELFFLRNHRSKDRSAPDYREKLYLVLRVTVRGTVKDNVQASNFLVLHAFLQMLSRVGPFIACCDRYRKHHYFSFHVLKHIKEKAPEQFRLRDGDGSLPLHIAVRNEHSCDHIHNESYSSEIIEFLLKEYPESAGLPDGQGRLPLHLAVETGLPCYEIIANAEPRALQTRCIVTHMYPFQLVFFRDPERYKKEWQWGLLNRTYKLLRKAPLMARGMASRHEWLIDTPEFK
jgi:hypothetical protein